MPLQYFQLKSPRGLWAGESTIDAEDILRGEGFFVNNRVYVGNVSFQTTEDAVRDLFAAHGEVVSIRMITDRETGRFRGFLFVEMATEEQAEAAIAALDGTEVDERPLKVNIARERPPRSEDR